MHNGIINGLGDMKRSDTSYYAEMLEKEYVENGYSIVKAIRELHKKVAGSYSVLVYEKSTGRVFYYKESSTNMYIIRDRNYIVMSTLKKNIKLAKYLMGLKGKICEVKDEKIYNVTSGFKKVGTFKDTLYSQIDDEDEKKEEEEGDEKKEERFRRSIGYPEQKGSYGWGWSN